MALVGSGAAAFALVTGLRSCGAPVAGVCARDESRARSAAASSGVAWLGTPASPAEAFAWVPVVVLAVSDGAIEETAATLARTGGSWRGRVVLHLSGSLGSELLSALRAEGAAVASWHPLATLGLVAATGWPSGIPFFAEGDAAALHVARGLTESLGGTWHELPSGAKPAYHAAATLAGNLVSVLFDAAASILEARGISEARAALAMLARGSLEAAILSPGLDSLTGPVARADAGTVRRNVQALSAEPAAIRAAHAALSLAANARLEQAGRGDAAARRAVAESLLDELSSAASELSATRGAGA